MTIAKRITSISGARTALTVAVTAISYSSLNSPSEPLNFIANDPTPDIILRSKIQGIEADLRQATLQHVASPDGPAKSEVAARIGDMRKSFHDTHAEYKKRITQPDDRELSGKMGASFDQSERGFEKIQSLYGQSKEESAYANYTADVLPATSKPAGYLDTEIQRNARNATNGSKAAVEYSGSARAHMVVLLAVSLGPGIGASWLAVRSLHATFRDVTAGLNEGASQVAGASGQVASSSQSLAQGSYEQAAALEEISASMEAITAMTKRNGENSSEAMAMRAETAGQVDKSSVALGEMAASVGVIKVSSEKAAKDTSALIEEAISNSNTGAGRLGQVATAIRGITESAGRVKRLIDEVNEASKQQAQGISQVAAAVHPVGEVTQTAAASAEEGTAVSDELSAQAQSVEGLVTRLQQLVDGKYRASAGKDRPAPRKAKPAPKSRVLKSFGNPAGAAAVEDEFPVDAPEPGSFKSV